MQPHVDIKLLTLPEVLAEVRCQKSLWYHQVRSGQAPRPVKIGNRALWLEHEIECFKLALLQRRTEVHGINAAGSMLNSLDAKFISGKN